MMASSSLGGGALALRGRFCMLPEPGTSYGRDSSHCLSRVARLVSNRILPETFIDMPKCMLCIFARYSDISWTVAGEILPKHLLVRPLATVTARKPLP
jgi:hypothetical protein